MTRSPAYSPWEPALGWREIASKPVISANQRSRSSNKFMGATQPRNYVVMFQNNAESRSLGGTALSFATLSIDKGKIHLASTISAGSDHFDNYADSAIRVPDGVDALYEGAFGHFIANATVRPQFSSTSSMTKILMTFEFNRF